MASDETGKLFIYGALAVGAVYVIYKITSPVTKTIDSVGASVGSATDSAANLIGDVSGGTGSLFKNVTGNTGGLVTDIASSGSTAINDVSAIEHTVLGSVNQAVGTLGQTYNKVLSTGQNLVTAATKLLTNPLSVTLSSLGSPTTSKNSASTYAYSATPTSIALTTGSNVFSSLGLKSLGEIPSKVTVPASDTDVTYVSKSIIDNASIPTTTKAATAIKSAAPAKSTAVTVPSGSGKLYYNTKTKSYYRA